MTDADRIAALETRVQALEEALGLTQRFPVEWGLTPMQQRMLGMLTKHPVVARERFMTALYGYDDDAPDDNVISVQLSRVRQKLARFGVEIRSAYGQGWWIPAEQKARLNA